MNPRIRINRYLASAGLGSRRKCESLVKEGRVFLGGERIDDFTTTIDPEKDVVTLDGKRIRLPAATMVLAMNKPTGVLSTVEDNRNRSTVLDIARSNGFRERLYPVGRLDMDTSGLILLTNDGDLSFRLTHPRYKIDKTYRVIASGRVGGETVRNIRDGVDLDDYRTRPCTVRIVRRLKDSTILEMTIKEGRKRQIRRMLAKFGHKVMELERTAIGDMSFNDIEVGCIRPLTDNEEKHLRRITGLS